MAYTAMQPLTAMVMTVLLLVLAPGLAADGTLCMPGLNSLGGVGIVAGLACIVWDDSRHRRRRTTTTTPTKRSMEEEEEAEDDDG